MANLKKSENQSLSPEIEVFNGKLFAFLKSESLPTESVFVDVSERHRVLTNLSSAIGLLDENSRPNSLYISKFVAASLMGLFDAALSYLWDETIQKLRIKVSRFDLEYFFDNAVSSEQRSKFKDEEDLRRISDDDLIRTCQKTGLISDIAYKHLDYIRDMRNHASAAHPNHHDISGFNLISWLETCIKEVIAKEPEHGAIQIKMLLNNIRNGEIPEDVISHTNEVVRQLPYDLAKSLLISLFGIYTAANTSTESKTNVRKIVQSVWSIAPESTKNELGLKYSTYLNNSDQEKSKYARDFLTLVDGLSYLPEGTRAIEIDRSLTILDSAHNEFNNFYNEVLPARILEQLVPASGSVPPQVASKYVTVLTHCYVGNGYGVSAGAFPIYEKMILTWSDKHIEKFIKLPMDVKFASKLSWPSCAIRFKELAELLQERASGAHLKQVLLFLAQFNTKKMADISSDKDYKKLIKPYTGSVSKVGASVP